MESNKKGFHKLGDICVHCKLGKYVRMLKSVPLDLEPYIKCNNCGTVQFYGIK